MSVETFTSITTFEIVRCCNCSVLFGIESGMYAALVRSHEWFYCPHGHKQHYTGKTDAERERDNTQAVQAQLNESRHALLVAQKKLAEEQAERSRVERRIHRGVCPCCNRTFGDLAKHMKTKHPQQISGNPKAGIAA